MQAVKRNLLAIILTLILGTASAQVLSLDSLLNPITEVDTLINNPQEKLDSIHTEFQQKTDSLQQELQDGLSKIENSKSSIQSKIDSLSTLNLSTEKYTAKLDSLNGKANELASSVNSKMEKLKTSTLGKVNEMELPPELKSQVDKLTGSISEFKLPGVDGLNISNLKLDGLTNLDIGNLGDLNIDGVSSITENLSLPDASLPEVGNLKELGTEQLGNIEGLENLSGISEQVGGYSEDIKSIANGDLGDVKQIPQAIEKEVMQMDELGALTEGTAALDEYKGMAESIKDQESIKEMAVEKAKEVAIDHFAGKEQVLNEAMQKKYSIPANNSILLKNPSRTEILKALEELSKRVTNKDNLLIFYAGHGVWDERLKVGYWLPSDSKVDDKSSWIANSTMRDYIAGIPSKHILLISDACFSGSIFKTREVQTSINEYGLSKIYQLSSRKAMTSGTLTTVPDESKFMQYLIKRLSENTDKYLTTRQLFFSFETAVLNNSSAVPQFGVIQDTGDEGGDFIFIQKD